MKVTANARRHGQWWAVEVPEVDGLYTQTRRLDQIPAMVADAVSLLTGRLPAKLEVEVVPALDEVDRAKLERARALQREAVAAQSRAADESRELVARLRAAGLTVRDVATIIGVSPQRVSQLGGVSRGKPGRRRLAGQKS